MGDARKFFQDHDRRFIERDPRGFARARAGSEVAVLVMVLRHREGLTQQQLADRTGLKRSCVARLESGEANPTVATLAAILAQFGEVLALRARPAGASEPATEPVAARISGSAERP